MRTRTLSIVVRAYSDRSWCVAIQETSWPPHPLGSTRLVLQRWVADHQVVDCITEYAIRVMEHERQAQMERSEGQKREPETL